jgi:hypothetical protein
MFKFRGQDINNFGYDNETKTEYKFNSLGYRSNYEFETNTNPVIILGNTISFGLGLPVEYTYAGILHKALDCPVYNFSWGCWAHTNWDQLHLLKQILQELRPCHVIFQINNLNRWHVGDTVSFDNPPELIVAEFEKFNIEIQQTLEHVPHSFLHWDTQSHAVNLPPCVIFNKYHVDHSLVSNINTFGSKSHKLIATKILQQGIV